MKKIWAFIRSKVLWLNILFMGILTVVLLIVLSFWLDAYTSHGERNELPDFVGRSMEQAEEIARENNYELIVTDSVFLVGKPGNRILNQNPEPGSYVKSNRKVYLTITKNQADLIDFNNISTLYGENYERKKRELADGYEIKSKVVGQMYDAGPAGHIMKVIFEGDTIVTRTYRAKDVKIPKGGTLEFIISKNSGGLVSIPNLTCMTYAEAKFLLNSYKLNVGSAEADGDVEQFNEAYVYKQEPQFSLNKKVEMGTSFTLYIQNEKPKFCP